MTQEESMSGSLQARWPAVALALSIAIAGCGGSHGDNEVSQAAHAGLETMQAAGVGHLQAGEARGFLSAHPDAMVLDVRDASDWDGEQGHIDGARQIPLGELGSRMGEIESWKSRPVVVVDRDGSRTHAATQMLTGAGFQQVLALEGGMIAWRQGAF
jgi:rhodanese-related sulfurtransferase